MKNKIVWILSILCIVAVAFSIFVLQGEDRNEPVIQFTEAIVYSPDMTREDLLKGVTATDQEDGDLSDRVVVESIVQSNGKDYVKVYYAVVDNSGNGVRIGREIPYADDADRSEESLPDESAEETVNAEEAEETPAEETPAEETPAPETAASSETAEVPVLTMKTDQATLARGSAFVYQEYVESITDDKDAQNDLFRQLVINGTYDINTPGTYPLIFYTQDSDGNTSNEVTFTLIIQ
ncbi:MAG: hypothetical protein ACLU6W_03205 [Lachnospiraceae bacterium]